MDEKRILPLIILIHFLEKWLQKLLILFNDL